MDNEGDEGDNADDLGTGILPLSPRVDSRYDRGKGSLADFTYDLYPRYRSLTIRLAGSDPFRDELLELFERGVTRISAFVERRIPEHDRIDAPIPVRLWVDHELSGVVGFIPRGIEGPIDACLGRLADRGIGSYIPSWIVSTRYGLRVDLQFGGL